MNHKNCDDRAKVAPFWRDSKAEICSKIRARKVSTKIVLKTRNEARLLKDWIAYYTNLVGPHGIVIFDNCSTDLSVLHYYQTLPEEIVVARYDGFHNAIHIVDLFPELYHALSESSEIFMFVDTDEILAGLRDDRTLLTNVELHDFLRETRGYPVLPTVWLNNLTFSDSIFKCGVDHSVLEWGLAWGKPMIRRNANIKDIVLHNVQLDAELYRAECPIRLVLKHLKELIPEQRIAVNREKLIKRKFASEEDSIEDILDRDVAGVHDTNVRMYLDEIRRLRAAKSPEHFVLNEGLLQFSEDGEISYFSNKEREAVRSFLTGDCFVTKVLIERTT